MKFECTEVWGFEHAIRGMRNPMNSWDKSDSSWELVEDPFPINPNDMVMYVIGPNDMGLAQRLIKAGNEHRKFLRQIFVSVDITAPLYWWKEFDTYKVGVTANSTSTMHKILSNPITLDCFETDDYHSIDEVKLTIEANLIPMLEELRNNCLRYDSLRTSNSLSNDVKSFYNEQFKIYWKELIRWLPESWLQTRTVTMNYENLLSMYRQRRNHKLSEWHKFCDWIDTLPYSEEFIKLEVS